jgi:hypothetical protein
MFRFTRRYSLHRWTGLLTSLSFRLSICPSTERFLLRVHWVAEAVAEVAEVEVEAYREEGTVYNVVWEVTAIVEDATGFEDDDATPPPPPPEEAALPPPPPPVATSTAPAPTQFVPVNPNGVVGFEEAYTPPYLTFGPGLGKTTLVFPIVIQSLFDVPAFATKGVGYFEGFNPEPPSTTVTGAQLLSTPYQLDPN